MTSYKIYNAGTAGTSTITIDDGYDASAGGSSFTVLSDALLEDIRDLIDAAYPPYSASMIKKRNNYTTV